MELHSHEITCVVEHIPLTNPDNSVSSSAIWLSPSYILAPGCLLGYSTDFSTVIGSSDEVNAIKGSFHLMASAENQSIHKHQLELVTHWQCSMLADTIDTLFSRSNLAQCSSRESESEVNHGFLSLFLLLRIVKGSFYHYSLQQLDKRIDQLDVGDAVMICSTPFGSTHVSAFENSWSTGIVSSCINISSGTFLCDASCIPGSQGGLVFNKLSMSPAAVVIHPVVWKNNECTGLSLIASLQAILKSLQDHISLTDLSLTEQITALSSCDTVPPTPQPRTNSTERLVRVKSNGAWGSGIILSQCFVLTCAHVVKGSNSHRITVTLPDGKVIPCVIIYASTIDKKFDVAVLQLNEILQETPIIGSPPAVHIGDQVTSHGYGIFEKGTGGVMTMGTVAKVHAYNNKAFSLVITSRVSCGSSGGTVTNSSGEIVGMIIANTYDATNDISYSELSFGLSLELIYDAIENLCVTLSTEKFRMLERKLKNWQDCDGISLKAKL